MVQISYVKLETELQYKYRSVFSVSSEVWQWVARKDQCQTQLAPSSSATDLPQDPAEPVSEAGGVSCESIFKEKVKY